MPLLLLGLIAVGAGILLVYYSVKDKKDKSGDSGERPNISYSTDKNSKDKDKGKVIYLFDDDDDGSGFSDLKPEIKKEDAVDSDDAKPDDSDKGHDGRGENDGQEPENPEKED